MIYDYHYFSISSEIVLKTLIKVDKKGIKQAYEPLKGDLEASSMLLKVEKEIRYVNRVHKQ